MHGKEKRNGRKSFPLARVMLLSNHSQRTTALLGTGWREAAELRAAGRGSEQEGRGLA